MIDLYEQLPEIEKIRLNNYIHRWGVKDNFIGLKEYLSNWNYSKQKLYKLLGNNFIYSKDIKYEKDKNELIREISELPVAFPAHWRNFIHFLGNYDAIKKGEDPFTIHFKAGKYFNDSNTEYSLINFVNAKVLAEGVVPECIFIKERKPDARREFRMQQGAKIFRAINQTLKYYDEELKYFEECWNKKFNEEIDLWKELEDYRIKYSIAVNDKYFSGKIHLSINPIDYLTMSDNNLNWTSCMNWTDAGCYRIGTVEMMNSNNVLCCYITKGKNETYDFLYRDKYYRDIDKEYDFENRNINEWSCSNKNWRQLFYVTKDIIIGEKAYPFISEELSKIILNIIKDLAKKNLNWDYRYGPELYRDMKYIKSKYSMDRAKGYLKYSPKKKNILFDTKGMYNDMIGNKSLNYWCYRNKVNKNKIYSISGKASCLCCGGDSIFPNDNLYYEDDYDSYQDEYLNCDNLICKDCLDEFCTCYKCGIIDPLISYKEINNQRLCPSCLSIVKVCPDCGKPFTLDGAWEKWINNKSYYIKSNKISYKKKMKLSNIKDISYNHFYQDYWLLTKNNYKNYKLIDINCCDDCLDKLKNKFKKVELQGARPAGNPNLHIYISEKEYDIEDPSVNKYFYWNLKNYESGDENNLTF